MHLQLDPHLYYCFTRSELCQAPLNLLSLISLHDWSVKIRTTDLETLTATLAHARAHSDAKRWTILRSHYWSDFFKWRGIINQYRGCWLCYAVHWPIEVDIELSIMLFLMWWWRGPIQQRCLRLMIFKMVGVLSLRKLFGKDAVLVWFFFLYLIIIFPERGKGSNDRWLHRNRR